MHLRVFMAVKTITITEDAYVQLASLRESDESFSDVILRVAGRSSLLELAGVLSKKDASELESAIKRLRKDTFY